MNKLKNNFKISFYFYIPLSIILGFINYAYEKEIMGSIILGLIGALSVFFVPLMFKNNKVK